MHGNAKIYVAGHNGLVGSAICRKLKEKGYENLVARSRGELDLTDQKRVIDFFRQEKPEYVFLAAAKVGGIMANNIYRADFILENLLIQTNIIHQSYLSGVKKLLFLGSTCVYPRDCPQPMKEEYLLTSPLEYTNEPYAIAKIAGLKMCESFNLQYGANYICVMPTNLYGPGDNFDLETAHVLPAILRKMHLGKCLGQDDRTALRADLNKRPIGGVDGTASDETVLRVLNAHGITLSGDKQRAAGAPIPVTLTLWGTGRPMREFLWSGDMADACVFIMENTNFSDLAGGLKEVRNTHINIGSGEEISIRDLALAVKKATGFNGALVFDPSKPDGTPRKLTDVSRLRQLGWNHKASLDQGIKMLYEWYLKNANNGNLTP